MLSTASEIKKIIVKADIELNIDQLQDNISLRDQGIDSLLFMDILLSVEEGYGIKIPDEDVDKLDTLQNIANYVQGRLDSQK